MTHGDRARHRRDQDARRGRRRGRRDPGRGARGRPSRAPTACVGTAARVVEALRAATGEALPRHRSASASRASWTSSAARSSTPSTSASTATGCRSATCSATGSACRSSWRTTSTPPPSAPSRSAAPTTSSTSASAPAWPPGWSSTAGCAAASTAPPARSATSRSTRTGALCSCGQRGCLETIASGSALAAAWPSRRRAAAAGAVRRRRSRRRAGDRASATGSPPASPSAVRVLSLAVDPRTIVLGGGVAQLGEPLRVAVAAALRARPRLAVPGLARPRRPVARGAGRLPGRRRRRGAPRRRGAVADDDLHVRGGTDATDAAGRPIVAARAPTRGRPVLDAAGLTVCPAWSTSRSTAPPASTSPPSRTGCGRSRPRCRRTASSRSCRPSSPPTRRRATQALATLAAGPPAGWAGRRAARPALRGADDRARRARVPTPSTGCARRRSTWSRRGRARPASLMVTIAPGAARRARGRSSGWSAAASSCRSGTPPPTTAEVEAAVAAGARCVTHLGNAMPPMPPASPARSASALGGDLVAGADRRRSPPRPAVVRTALAGARARPLPVGLRHHRRARAARRDRPGSATRTSSSPTARSGSPTAPWPARLPRCSAACACSSRPRAARSRRPSPPHRDAARLVGDPTRGRSTRRPRRPDARRPLAGARRRRHRRRRPVVRPGGADGGRAARPVDAGGRPRPPTRSRRWCARDPTRGARAGHRRRARCRRTPS